jgi:cytidine deaminase
MSQDSHTGDASLQRLFAAARKAAENAYAPYSRFQVGAALELTNGSVVSGANVENTSYGLTVCAECAAVVRAVAENGPNVRVRSIAVANLANKPSPPCGACRQVLAEFVEPDAQIVFQAEQGTRCMPFAELLPLTFDLGAR